MNYIKNKESHITKVHNNIKSKSLSFLSIKLGIAAVYKINIIYLKIIYTIFGKTY